MHYLLFADANCSFQLKLEGENTLRQFPDFLGALHFIRQTKGQRSAEVSVYDSRGRATFKHMPVESGDFRLLDGR